MAFYKHKTFSVLDGTCLSSQTFLLTLIPVGQYRSPAFALKLWLVRLTQSPRPFGIFVYGDMN